MRTRAHIGTAFYQEAAFRNGQSTLNPLEREALGDVTGKRVLHLQCHFGLDSLSLARAGAIVTGLDFSDVAIRYARELSESSGIPATFLCSHVYDFPASLAGSFDVVFTSYGVVHWLSDLNRWASVIRRALVPAGTFLIVEFHPLELLFDSSGAIDPSFRYSSEGKPIHRIAKGTYADPEAQLQGEAWNWRYGIGEVVTALAFSGLRIAAVREYPIAYSWGADPKPDSRPVKLPRLYSVIAHAPAARE